MKFILKEGSVFSKSDYSIPTETLITVLGDLIDTLSQKNIDFIIENSHKKREVLYPKGIQEKTLQTILGEIKKNLSEWVTGDELAERISLTGVTVRRYLNYLTEKRSAALRY